jgi:AraC-like DNA-binding protein
MLGSRYEEYGQVRKGVPFVLNANIKRTPFNLSKETNWHENLEIQFCQSGSGTVLLDGRKYAFNQGDIAVANTNVIHYTSTQKVLVYDALIVGTDFCDLMGLDFKQIIIQPLVRDQSIFRAFSALKEAYLDLSIPYRIPRINKLLLDLLIGLSEKYRVQNDGSVGNSKDDERIRLAIICSREHYKERISLDDISRAVYCDKYTLCKEFKKHTGQTVFENLNRFRCIKALDCLTNGTTVAEAAAYCGFDNLSFFTKTFKKYIGGLPSDYKSKKKI